MPHLFVLPSVDAEADVRLDTDADTDSPAVGVVFAMGGGWPIDGAKLNAAGDGALPRVITRDGTDTLFLKTLDYKGAQIGDPVEVAGIDQDATADASGASPVAVYTVVTGLLSAAACGDGEYMALDTFPGEGSAGWDATDVTTLLPPSPGVYAVSLQAYVSGGLDESAEIILKVSGSGPGSDITATAGLPADAAGVLAGSASRVVTIPDGATGIRVQGGYVNSPPTTGTVHVTVWVHRVGDLPA